MTGCGVRYVVDGMNVIGSRPDGWWRDRPGARRALVQEMAGWAAGHDVTVVFDGRPSAGEAEAAAAARVSARFAPGGPNAADDAIVEMVRVDPSPDSLVVVTSDAALVRRVEAHGAGVIGAKAWRDLLGR